jgi:hypothetical protein
MKFFLLLILMSASLVAQSQTTFSVTIPQDVATQQWVREYVQKKLDSIKASIPPVITLPPCTEGPEIKTISNATRDYLTFRFHGENVTALYWWIGAKELSQPLRSGNIDPTNNTIKLSFETLPPGDYVFGLVGTKCTGSDTKEFTIK